MKNTKQAEINVIVLGQDCLSLKGANLTPEECEAISRVFVAASAAIRDRKHGVITCKQCDNQILAEVGIDQGEDFPFEEDGEGLPLIEEVKL